MHQIKSESALDNRCRNSHRQ